MRVSFHAGDAVGDDAGVMGVGGDGIKSIAEVAFMGAGHKHEHAGFGNKMNDFFNRAASFSWHTGILGRIEI